MFHVEQQTKEKLKVKDFLVSGEEFSLLYNSELEMLVTHPKPSVNELPKYYESEEYISHTDSNKGILNFLYQKVKGYSLSKKVTLINKLNKGAGALLDIGAGTGDFLFKAQNNGWQIEGVEVNPKARIAANKKGMHLEEAISKIKANQFDVITLWHVLEHLPNLDQEIENLGKLLKEGGHLVIAVPNFKSYDAKYYQEHWAAYDVPRHLWHFSRKSIPMLFSKKFKLVKTLPLVFDSFYVSLLSEKYKNENAFSIKAFWIGLLSNLKAKRTGEYSSLIYCLKKG